MQFSEKFEALYNPEINLEDALEEYRKDAKIRGKVDFIHMLNERTGNVTGYDYDY
jgi:hypothetical protein